MQKKGCTFFQSYYYFWNSVFGQIDISPMYILLSQALVGIWVSKCRQIHYVLRNHAIFVKFAYVKSTLKHAILARKKLRKSRENIRKCLKKSGKDSERSENGPKSWEKVWVGYLGITRGITRPNPRPFRTFFPVIL